MYTDISQYLTESYEDGFVGAVYDLHGQGVPLIFPIDQEQAVRSLKNNSKLSKGLWGSLAQGNSKLQNNLRTEISRGFSQGHSYAQVAKSVSNQMNIGFNKVSRIVRTESHRISNEAAMDAAYKAKEAGADVVKQWDSTLDKRTRPHHSQLDGQIRELDEPFEVAGHTAMYPGGFGVASEDIHCRCAVLQRAKWALNEDELQMLKDRATYFGLDKTDSFDDFKKKYLDITGNTSYNDVEEMYRKGYTHRKRTVDGKQIIDKATYHKITNPAIKCGAEIRFAQGEYLQHIQKYGSAVTIGDVIYFTPDVTVSDVLEEVHHFYQNKFGLNSKYPATQRRIMNEIDAQNYLLSVTEKYNIPTEEVELTRENLRFYNEKKKEMIERGEWID